MPFFQSTSSSAVSSLASLPSGCPTILTPTYNAPVVAPGWTAQLVVTGLTSPRSIIFDDVGALLVVQSGKGIQHITFDDYGDTCLVVKTSVPLVEESDVCIPSPCLY
jgi:hypothetical protein